MMNSNSKIIRRYFCNLIKSSLEVNTPLPIPEGVTEAEIIEYAKKGQIQYPIFSSLLKLDISDKSKEVIVPAVKRCTLLTFLQVMGARQISAAFEDKGIKHQLLKGIIIKDIYPSPEMRQMSDIDLIVFDESLDRAAEVMESMGFKNHGLIKHHMVFSNKHGLCIEVHWCLVDKSVDNNQYLHFKDNFNSRLKEGTKYTYEFGVEDFYIYMIAHMAKHFFETGCGIRNLVDIYIYWNRYSDEMDKDYLEKELKICGIFDFEKHMRELAYIWLDDKVCPEFYENLFAYMLDCGIYGKGENGIWSQLAKETAKKKGNLKLHYYFPSLSFMKEKYSWLNKAPFLLPVAWIIRAFTGLLSKKSQKHMELFKQTSDENVDVMMDIYHKMGLNYRR